jgi:peptide chain release factor subunit 1
LFKGLDVIKEKGLMSRFLQEVVKARGLAGYGEKEVRKLIEMGAVATLLISEDLDSGEAKVSCSNCDYKDTERIKSLKIFKNQISGNGCPKCNKKNLRIDDFRSAMDEFTELAESTGANVEMISTETEEGQQLVAFGGIAAILRFKP